MIEAPVTKALVEPRLVRIVLALILLGFVGYMFSQIRELLHGGFSYTLDDPYIHLRLADQILRGHYGINGNEFSSPSSSILWPFLLAPFTVSKFALFAPLLINCGCLVASTLIAYSAFRPLNFAPFYAMALVFLTNGFGLVFTGMEHSLQVLLTVLCAVGALRERDTGKVPPWLIGALIAGPLIRYENLGISVPLLVYLGFRGHTRTAIAGATACIGSLVAFSFFLRSLGLGWLPNSVMAKNDYPGESILQAAVHQLQHSFGNHRNEVWCLLGLLLIIIGSASRKDWGLAAVAVSSSLIHLLFGKFGWLGRYEPYIFAFVFTLAIGMRIGGREFGRDSLVLALGAIMTFLYGFHTAAEAVRHAREAPEDSAAIYRQQYQMARFCTQYWKAPIAINDLGWVSWDNDQYVLDLYGLASAEALKDRLERKDGKWMDDLCVQRRVQLAIIYPGAFRAIPKNWIRIADMDRPPSPNILGQNQVSFYVTDPKAVKLVFPLLLRFGRSLPPGDVLNVLPVRQDLL